MPKVLDTAGDHMNEKKAAPISAPGAIIIQELINDIFFVTPVPHRSSYCFMLDPSLKCPSPTYTHRMASKPSSPPFFSESSRSQRTPLSLLYRISSMRRFTYPLMLLNVHRSLSRRNHDDLSEYSCFMGTLSLGTSSVRRRESYGIILSTAFKTICGSMTA